MFAVTGASQGIGLACARQLLSRTGAEVLITGRSLARLEAARASLPPCQRDRLVVQVCDQARLSDVEALCETLVDRQAVLDGVILGVGVNPREEAGPRRLHLVPAAVAAAAITTNCTHLLRISAAVLGRFLDEGRGAVVWIGSQGYRVGIPGSGVYGATKGFLVGLAYAAHREYASRGVRVHVVHPGVVRTPRHGAGLDRFAAKHGVKIHDPQVVAGRLVNRLLDPSPGPVEVDT